MKNASRVALVAWLIAAVYYFYQYMLRSAPAVMLPELSTAFGISAAGVASLAGLFYYGYSPFSLVAGVAMDKFGPRKVIPIGAALVGIGSLMFASGDARDCERRQVPAGRGRCVRADRRRVHRNDQLSPSRAATLIGATQMFGMGGGSAGQFAVGPMIAAGVAWSSFWLGMGVIGLVIAGLLLFLLPRREAGAACQCRTGSGRAQCPGHGLP